MPSSSLSPPFPVPQYNIQYNFIAKCQYSARGMFCGARYTSHIHSSKKDTQKTCKLMISSTFHWKSNFTHGSDESLTFSTEILNLHSDRKFHCTESWHKPHLHTGRFTVKKKGGGGVRGFCQLSFLGLYHTKGKPFSGALSYKRQTCHPFQIMRWSHSLSGLQLGPVVIFSTYFTCQVKVWPKNSSSDHCQQLSHSLGL